MVDGAWPRGLSLRLAAALAVAALCAAPGAVASSRLVDAQRQVPVGWDADVQACAAAHQLRPSSVATASDAGEDCSEPLRKPERETRAPLRKPERIPSVDQMGCAWIPVGTSRRTDLAYEDGRASNPE
jgi:hypothetical protein